MPNPYIGNQATIEVPVYKWQGWVPADDTDLGNIGAYMRLPTADTSLTASVKIGHADGTTHVYEIAGGMIIPTSVKRIYATGTTLPAGVTKVDVGVLYP